MNYNAWFQCIRGCPGQFSLLEVIYRCPACGDLLEVHHDTEALKTRAASAWIKLFDERLRQNAYPYGSGVWAKKEWVVPFIDDGNIVSTFEGHTHNTKEGVGRSVYRRREHRFHLLSKHQSILLQSLRQTASPRGSLGQTM